MEPYGEIPRHECVPIENLETATNDPRAVAYFETLMAQHAVPGWVDVVPR